MWCSRVKWHHRVDDSPLLFFPCLQYFVPWKWLTKRKPLSIPTSHLLNMLSQLFLFAFFSQSHSNALLPPFVSSTLLSVFPSPYINPSEGEVSQVPNKKNIPQNKDLWNGILANSSKWVCLEFLDEGFSTGSVVWPLVFTYYQQNTSEAEWWWISFKFFSGDCNLPCC